MASDPLTVGQVAFFLGVVPVLTAWIYSEVFFYAKHRTPANECLDVSLVELSPKDDERDNLLETGAADGGAPAQLEAELPNTQTLQRIPIMLDTFLVDNRGTLRSMAEFVGLIFYFFLCDRTTALGESKKEYSRDLFIFLYLLLVLYSMTSSLKKHVEKSAVSGRSVMFLNRHQTEEWKGWMQVLFLMYHYFNAREIYNAIRVFIAAYVWMTGFGNFSYYYVRKDFSLGRFAQMMWRLNFLVFFTCVVLNNDYMLYYICPMHTFFTILVYATLGIAHKHNGVPPVMAAKFLASFSLIVIVWEIPGVFEFVWSPLTFLMKYNNPHKSFDDSPLHEWHFRSGLDRYVWMVGMLYAYFHPNVERLLEKWEELEYRARVASKAIVLFVTLAAGYLWFEHVYKLDKQEYNKLHPYTSWIPISVFIVLRNFSQPLRNWSVTLFAWLGKITLETYIAQFHIWLRTGTPNGQPRFLLSVIPDYPLLNLMFTTAAYVLVSHRLFQLTNELKTAFVPGSDNKRLLHMFVSGLIIAVSTYGICYRLVAVPKFLVWAI